MDPYARGVRLFVGITVGGLIAPAICSAADDPKIERAWKAKCSSCHGADGKGQTEQGKKMAVGDMTSPAWQKERKDEAMKAAILDGFKREKDGKTQEMKPFKDKLKPEEVDGLLAFVRKLAK